MGGKQVIAFVCTECGVSRSFTETGLLEFIDRLSKIPEGILNYGYCGDGSMDSCEAFLVFKLDSLGGLDLVVASEEDTEVIMEIQGREELKAEFESERDTRD